MKAAMPKQVASGVYQLGLGGVNVFFVEDDDGGLWLIDAGIDAGAERIGGGIRALGRAPQELRGVVVTHLHGDHVGGLAAVKEHTGAEVWMQAEDAAACARACAAARSSRAPARVPHASSCDVDGGGARSQHRRPDRRRARGARRRARCRSAADGRAHAGPHARATWRCCCRRDGGVLFAGDAATDLGRLGVGPVYEDVDEGMRSLRRWRTSSSRRRSSRTGGRCAPRAAERFRARFAARLTAARASRRRRLPALSLPKNRSLTSARRDVS